MTDYSLNVSDYSWKNALFWGNFIRHCQKIQEGSFCDRCVHILIAIAEFCPILSQIASIFEKIIVSTLKPQLSSSAIKIQCLFRGYKSRKKTKQLPKYLLQDTLFEKAKPYIENPDKLKGLATVSCGRSRVYLPNDLPLVLKLTKTNNHSRYDNMKLAKKICVQNKYFHLTIPKANTYANFIIEDRLPIMTHCDTKRSIGFYIENLDTFNSAVKEFTGFLCQSHLSDIIGGNRDPYGSLCKISIGRYENVSLYIETVSNRKIGKIGLVDLEDFSLKSTEESRDCFFAVQDAITLFPYHFDIIMQAAQRFDNNIETHRKKLEAVREIVLKFFKTAYLDHLEFIKNKNWTLKNVCVFDPINEKRRAELNDAICLALMDIYRNYLKNRFLASSGLPQNFRSHSCLAIRQWSLAPNKNSEDPPCQIPDSSSSFGIDKNHTWYGGFLGEIPDKSLARFKEIFPEILDLVLEHITEKLNANARQGEVTSYSEMLSCRTFKLEKQSYRNLIQKISDKLDMFKCEDFQQPEYATLAVNQIFEELAKGKEIACFIRHFGFGGDERLVCC